MVYMIILKILKIYGIILETMRIYGICFIRILSLVLKVLCTFLMFGLAITGAQRLITEFIIKATETSASQKTSANFVQKITERISPMEAIMNHLDAGGNDL